MTRALNDEYVFASDIFVELDRNLAILELRYRCIAHTEIKAVRYLARERRVGIPRKHHHFG